MFHFHRLLTLMLITLLVSQPVVSTIKSLKTILKASPSIHRDVKVTKSVPVPVPALVSAPISAGTDQKKGKGDSDTAYAVEVNVCSGEIRSYQNKLDAAKLPKDKKAICDYYYFNSSCSSYRQLKGCPKK